MSSIELTVRPILSVVLVCLVLAPSSSSQIKSSNEVAHRVDEFVSALGKLGPFSGSILIAKDGRVLLSKGYGMANLEHDVPNTPLTKFPIASVTKPFTATAIMLLQERGKLNVQDTVCKYLSPCPETWQKVTIHHLLTHTSGIPNNTAFDGDDETKSSPSTAASPIERFKVKTLEFQSGERYEYSNSGYVLLGYIIERASGKSYEDFLRENIFEPLKMMNTGYDHPRLVLKHRAQGYIWEFNKFINAASIDMGNHYASGGLYSTVEDLFLFDQALYTDKLLTKKSLDTMFTPFKDRYGYGWQLDHQFNHSAISHSGKVDGFTGNIARFPDGRTSVIFLSNIENARMSEITQYLAAIALGEKYNLLELASPIQQIQIETTVRIDPNIYDAYVGQYDLPMGVFTITRDGDKLMGQAAGEPSKAELLPQSATQFFIRGPGEVQVTFIKNSDGQVTYIKLMFRGREFQGKKIK